MALNQAILQAFRSEKATKDLLNRLAKDRLVEAGGLAGSSRALLMAECLRESSGLILLEDLNDAEALHGDLLQILGSERVFLLPPREHLPYDRKLLPVEKRSALMEILRKLRLGESLVMVSTIRQLCSRFPDRSTFDQGLYHLEVGMELDRDSFVESLENAGFKRENAVEDIAQYAMRGGILDVYPWGLEFPIRLEFFGDELESIRAFDPSTQTSTEHLPMISLGIHSTEVNSYVSSLFDLLHKDTLVISPSTDILREHFKHFSQRADAAWQELDRQSEHLHPAEKYLDHETALTAIMRHPRLILHPARRIHEAAINYDTAPQESFMRNTKLLAENLLGLNQEGYTNHILCDNAGQLDRLREIFDELGQAPSSYLLSLGSLQSGFQLHGSQTVVYTDHEIFGRPRLRRHIKRFKRATLLRRIENLEPGDHVVHIRYGIGKFDSLTTISVNGHEREVLRIQYSGTDCIYVRLENFRDIEKYSGQEGLDVKLNKLGSGEWDRVKKRTKKSIQKIAKELIELYAKRRMSRGFQSGPDTVWQREMEAAFEFEETADQLSAIKAVKEDMEAHWPMDRLICGDVGFGKTEVAVRAAFKAVCDGRQAAILVPTTILAQQHFNTFSARFADFPVTVDVLSRFKTRGELTQSMSDIREGKVDIVIGTHRILSKDVKFKNLGLLVVDEEQRFGVLHKERMKQLRSRIDVMTLTATPIPRTLDMAMLGIKDLSLVNIPPVNRLPIETEIVAFNKKTIRSAILREHDRNGQVYFVHNRVQTIEAMGSMIRELVPEVRVEIGHGQMKERELEGVMMRFMRKEFDVLVSTMIIETGLDIPNVNTMLVNRADTFGLSQLYQLRGRIGRSHRQAYAFLLTPGTFDMKPDAKRRLHTIGEFTDLGSGFKIAMRDLEIRGAGNILGAEQSGQMTRVGYELYNRLLEEAILELKNEGAQEEDARPDCHVELPANALLPADYVEDPGERVNLYRRLQQCAEVGKIASLRDEICDRFGGLPREALMLFAMVELQSLGREANLRKVDLSSDTLQLIPFTESDEETGLFLSRLRRLDSKWTVEVHGTPTLCLHLQQKGLDWGTRIEQTRHLLREIGAKSATDSQEETP
jgi:transcription-repair coupling factor (superfamily II helicase)